MISIVLVCSVSHIIADACKIENTVDLQKDFRIMEIPRTQFVSEEKLYSLSTEVRTLSEI